jgi:hypothetical protein
MIEKRINSNDENTFAAVSVPHVKLQTDLHNLEVQHFTMWLTPLESISLLARLLQYCSCELRRVQRAFFICDLYAVSQRIE